MVDPWVGLGLGVEVLTISETRTVQAITNSGAVVDVALDRSTHYSALPELRMVRCTRGCRSECVAST